MALAGGDRSQGFSTLVTRVIVVNAFYCGLVAMDKCHQRQIGHNDAHPYRGRRHQPQPHPY